MSLLVSPTIVLTMIVPSQLQTFNTTTREPAMDVDSPQEASAPQQVWSGGLTPLQLAFAEAERCQQASDRASQQRVSSKRLRGSCRRIPCRARGMSTKHNIDTAFFDVPSDAPHGMLLSCSHPECVASGKRFRFCVGKCSVCRRCNSEGSPSNTFFLCLQSVRCRLPSATF